MPARKSGDWARRRHHYLRNYCGITTKAIQGKLRLVYLDVMAGPGLCKIKETGEEFAGSPLVALNDEFDRFIFIEDTPELAEALKQRIAKHPKAKRAKVIAECWLEVAKSGRLLFDDKTLVVAFIDPTGISQVPLRAMLELTKNPRIDLLVTIQHSLGITWNVPQYLKSTSGQTALDAFLGTKDWRKWKRNEPSQFTLKAIDWFSERIRISHRLARGSHSAVRRGDVKWSGYRLLTARRRRWNGRWD